MRLENGDRFALDNNNLILDFDDPRDKYCLEPEEVCELLNKQNRALESVIKITEDVLDAALKNSSLNSAYYDKLLDYLDKLVNNAKGDYMHGKDI